MASRFHFEHLGRAVPAARLQAYAFRDSHSRFIGGLVGDHGLWPARLQNLRRDEVAELFAE
jgi:hypothetical protein